MPDTIRDGKGSGSLVKVEDNLLYAKAITETMLAHQSHGNSAAYSMVTPMLTLTTTGGRMVWFANNDTRDFNVDQFSVSYNGGSTNHNRCCVVYAGFADTVAPTTNTTTGAMGNMNKGAVATADADWIYWNETGDCMTGGTEGALSCLGTVGQGRNFFPTNSAFIIPPNKTMVIGLVAEEIGEANISMRGYFATLA